MNDFVKCFDNADEVWMLPIYPAREKSIKGVSSYNLAKQLEKIAKKSNILSLLICVIKK